MIIFGKAILRGNGINCRTSSTKGMAADHCIEYRTSNCKLQKKQRLEFVMVLHMAMVIVQAEFTASFKN